MMKVTMTKSTAVEIEEQLTNWVNMASLQIEEWEEEGGDMEEGDESDLLEGEREEVAELLNAISWDLGIVPLEAGDEEIAFDLTDYGVELLGRLAADVTYRVETPHGEISVTLGPQNNADAFAQFSDNIEPDGRMVKGEQETA